MTEESRVSAPDPRVEPVSCHIELNFELSWAASAIRNTYYLRLLLQVTEYYHSSKQFLVLPKKLFDIFRVLAKLMRLVNALPG